MQRSNNTAIIIIAVDFYHGNYTEHHEKKEKMKMYRTYRHMPDCRINQKPEHGAVQIYFTYLLLAFKIRTELVHGLE